ncbi:uncharacterized protein H6S33_010360 [Morchella sextelata]|uniref:uncharacterized protein n=1 Tax=Morchella sextelata TaxID=1174677 RepID=UPI001D039A94|nr:uncharacterized protein H6S33_010360 [Morchella sextelata]KAH0612308.1 hypothetical protein H6S33_010360 [Morchella sextelata]
MFVPQLPNAYVLPEQSEDEQHLPGPFDLLEQAPDDLFELFNSLLQFNQLLPFDSPCNFDIPEPDPLIVAEPAAIDLPAPVVDVQPENPSVEVSEPAALDLPAPVVDVHSEKSSTEVLCSGKCKGNLLGPHKCQRLQRRLHIACLSTGNCTHISKSKNDFNRHCRTKHGLRKELLNCTVAGCEKVGVKGFSRRDNLLQHLRRVHGEELPVIRYRFGPAPA